jgi:hypothetical protein
LVRFWYHVPRKIWQTWWEAHATKVKDKKVVSVMLTHVRLSSDMSVCAHICPFVLTHVRLCSHMSVCAHTCPFVLTHVSLWSYMSVCGRS